MHSAAQIPLAMLLVFAAAKLLAEIFERLGQPGIVGEILAGVLIGPQVLGWLAPCVWGVRMPSAWA
jgi:Kef-type K+ transport system membrane component KefB